MRVGNTVKLQKAFSHMSGADSFRFDGTCSYWRCSFESVLRNTIFGLLLHDRGPFIDYHENGVDPKRELQFHPPLWLAWRWLDSPDPMIS